MSIDINPRAIAVLVALRLGARSAPQISYKISDEGVSDTIDLLDTMALSGLVVRTRQAWELTLNGIMWLADHGLEVTS